MKWNEVKKSEDIDVVLNCPSWVGTERMKKYLKKLTKERKEENKQNKPKKNTQQNKTRFTHPLHQTMHPTCRRISLRRRLTLVWCQSNTKDQGQAAPAQIPLCCTAIWQTGSDRTSATLPDDVIRKFHIDINQVASYRTERTLMVRQFSCGYPRYHHQGSSS